MTSGTEWQDPFLVRPDESVRSGKPLYAPPTRAVDPSIYALNAPTGYSTEAFSRTWKVTFRRWGRGWLAFLALGLLAAAILSAAYPSPTLRYNEYDGGTMPYYIGTFIGLAIAYLAIVGWWLDHILASSGWKTSLVVQCCVAGFFGLAGGIGGEGKGDPSIGFPVFYLLLVGAASVALGQYMGRKVEGSFKPSMDTSYFPPSM